MVRKSFDGKFIVLINGIFCWSWLGLVLTVLNGNKINLSQSKNVEVRALRIYPDNLDNTKEISIKYLKLYLVLTRYCIYQPHIW